MTSNPSKACWTDSYSRLESVAKRMEVYDVQTVAEAQEQLNLESAFVEGVQRDLPS